MSRNSLNGTVFFNNQNNVKPECSIDEAEVKLRTPALSEKQLLCLLVEKELREWRSHTPVFNDYPSLPLPEDALERFYDCFYNVFEERLLEVYRGPFKATRLSVEEERALSDELASKYGYQGSEIDQKFDRDFRMTYYTDLNENDRELLKQLWDEDGSEREDPTEVQLEQEEREVKAAVHFVKKLLDTSPLRARQGDSFAFECLSYLVNRYKTFDNFDAHTEQWRVIFKPAWEGPFLEFIKGRLWAKLIEADLVSKAWQAPCDYSNIVYAEIFTYNHASLFKFAGHLIEFINEEDLQELTRAYPFQNL